MVGTTMAAAATPSEKEGLASRVELLRSVADPTRLGVLELLAATGERCHCELEEALGVPANRLSFHLKVLRDANLVGTRRRGRWVHYRVEAEGLTALHDALPRLNGADEAAPGRGRWDG